MDALLREHQVAHAVVVKGHQRIGKHRQLVERGVRLFAAAAAFKAEGHGGEDHHEGSFLAGDAADDRRRAGAGATAETDAEEDDLASLERGADFAFGLEHRLLAELRITAGAEALGQVPAELDAVSGDRAGERADVGVDRQHFRAVHAVEDHTVEHVGARTAEADDFHGGGRDGVLCVAREFDHGIGSGRGRRRGC